MMTKDFVKMNGAAGSSLATELQAKGGTFEQAGSHTQGSGSLYAGESGTANWLAVTLEPGYPLNADDKFSLRVLRREAISAIPFNSLVSFGPGDGANDHELLGAMQGTQSRLNSASSIPSRVSYIPIDISEAMLKHAITGMDSHIEVPAVVACDFEMNNDFLSRVFARHCKAPVLYSMLGGTFANLDLGEAKFLEWLRSQFKQNDAFLIDVPTACAEWSVDAEPRLYAKSYSPAFRRFLSFGAAQNETNSRKPLEELTDEILKDFENRFTYIHTTDADTGSEQITVVDQKHQKPTLRFRRYRFDLLLSWIERQGFKVSFSRHSDFSINNRFGMGVILIR